MTGMNPESWMGEKGEVKIMSLLFIFKLYIELSVTSQNPF